MGTTAPAVTDPALAAPTVPAAQVEEAIETHTPEAVRPEVAEAEKEFNTFAEATVDKGKVAGAAIEDKNPDLTTALQDAEKGDVAGVIAEAPAVTKIVKAGYKTTEFWLTLAGVIATQLGAIHVPGKYGSTIQDSALIAAYVLSRGLAK